MNPEVVEGRRVRPMEEGGEWERRGSGKGSQSSAR